jgi:threonine dehydrogenase-like Zn-dependent dehydrogenase
VEQGVRALVWHGGRKLSVEGVPAPEARDGEVVFDVGLAGICGSDLHPYRGEAGPRRPPLVLGHEAVGTVPGRPGRFTVFPLVACGTCAACARGEENLCERRGLLGLDRQGVFAEQVAVRADALVPLPDELDDELAVLVEPLATCVSALGRGEIGPGSSVLVVGGGPIGLLAAYVAAGRGARVLVAEPLPERRAVARRMGAAETVAGVEEAPPGAADVALDAVGLETTWRGAVAGVRAGGSVVLLGLAQAEGAMPVGDLVRRGITVRGHYAYSRADFEAALTLLSERPPPLGWLDVLALDQGAEGFRRLVEEPARATKILLQVSPRRSGGGR